MRAMKAIDKRSEEAMILKHIVPSLIFGLCMFPPLPALSQTGSTDADSTVADAAPAATGRPFRELRAALGRDLTPDEREQVLTELAALGENGEVGALLLLANTFQADGNIEKAISFFEAAAKLDAPAASVALMRLLGDATSPFHDPERATSYLIQAAEAGNNTARFALARALLAGEGMDADPSKARELLADLAPDNSAAAQQAGDLARDGIGGPVDGPAAQRFYQMAAEAGRDTAWLRLGSLLLSGELVEKDPSGALAAFQKAAAGGRCCATQA
jgi:uncharacterized protein